MDRGWLVARRGDGHNGKRMDGLWRGWMDGRVTRMDSEWMMDGHLARGRTEF